MSTTDKISAKEIIVGVASLVFIAAAMFYTLSIFNAEGGKKLTDISQAGDKSASHVETHVTILGIDPIKGDITARFQFEPSEKLLLDDGTLKQGLSLYLNSANGKQEIDFPKGKLMTPVEGVFTMADGQASEYPFDKYTSDITVYIMKGKTPAKDEKKKPEVTAAKTAEEPAADEPKEDEASDDMAISVDFEGSIPGYNIAVAKGKGSDVDYVVIDAAIERSGTVKFFSIFVCSLMWVLATCVLFLVGALVFRGRKIEVGMLSFMGALLFAFYAVRNSQPNIPPIGVYSDFISFFWAEALLAICLIVTLLVWVLRPAK